ncbi:MAG: hypothetical protein JWR20_2807 [Marmoricola sp.]|nr:hypothetical protein [Marmoricola sp.]
MALAAALCLAPACSRETDLAPPRPTAVAQPDHAGPAQSTLDALAGAFTAGSASQAAALAAPGSTALLASLGRNARALRVQDVSLRYVDDAAPLPASQQATLGQDAWRGTVELEYRFAGVDRRAARMDTSVVFVPRGGRARVASFGGDGARTPLWLQTALVVRRTPGTLLSVAGTEAGRFPQLVSRALGQVRHTLPAWRGPLVVEVPRTRDQLNAALHDSSSTYDDIAGVTTTEDGTLTPGSPVRVFLNPDVFHRLERRGAQVVMSHEATHVATGATFVSMPTWLLEGFADYVALRDTGISVRTAASQILARVRRDGPPDGLPTRADLDPTATGLGATYEEAWLACRFLGERFGNARMVAFYDAVSGGEPVARAFRTVLGTTQARFVAAWRADTSSLAGRARVAR